MTIVLKQMLRFRTFILGFLNTFSVNQHFLQIKEKLILVCGRNDKDEKDVTLAKAEEATNLSLDLSGGWGGGRSTNVCVNRSSPEVSVPD